MLHGPVAVKSAWPRSDLEGLASGYGQEGLYFRPLPVEVGRGVVIGVVALARDGNAIHPAFQADQWVWLWPVPRQ